MSQRQAIKKLLEKPNRDKRYVANWRPISLLNFNLKIISKSLTNRLKKFLKSGRLIDDVLKVCDIQKLSGYLLTVDFEKAFDFLNHKFLIAVLKNMVLVMILLTGY